MIIITKRKYPASRCITKAKSSQTWADDSSFKVKPATQKTAPPYQKESGFEVSDSTKY